jgi:predicted transcriptional regulator
MKRKLTSSNVAKALGVKQSTLNRSKYFKGKTPEEVIDSLESTEKATQRKENAIADLREIERDEKRGKLLNAAKIAIEIDAMFSAVRSRVLSIGNKIASQLALESDAAACQNLVDGEATEALNELSNYPICTHKTGSKKGRGSSQRRRGRRSVSGPIATAG